MRHSQTTKLDVKTILKFHAYLPYLGRQSFQWHKTKTALGNVLTEIVYNLRLLCA